MNCIHPNDRACAMGEIAQAKHTARVLIGEARARRVGQGFWCIFRMAQSARRRATAALSQPVAIADRPAGLPLQLELFA